MKQVNLQVSVPETLTGIVIVWVDDDGVGRARWRDRTEGIPTELTHVAMMLRKLADALDNRSVEMGES